MSQDRPNSSKNGTQQKSILANDCSDGQQPREDFDTDTHTSSTDTIQRNRSLGYLVDHKNACSDDDRVFPSLDISDEMFEAAAAMLGIPICVSLDAIVGYEPVTSDPTDDWNISIDLKKILPVCEAYIRTSADRAAWHSIREECSVTDAAMLFGIARENVSRARTRIIAHFRQQYPDMP